MRSSAFERRMLFERRGERFMIPTDVSSSARASIVSQF